MASSHISIADGSERRLLRGPFFGMLLSTMRPNVVLPASKSGWSTTQGDGGSSPVRGCGKDIYYDLRRQRSVSVLASNCLDIATTFNYTVAHFGDTSAMDYLPGLNSRASFRETLALPVTDSDFLRRSSSNKRMRNVAMAPLQSPLDVIHHPNHAQAQPSTMESAPELEIDIDLDSFQSGKRTPFSLSLSSGQYRLFTASLVSGILVSREMITAIDYGSPLPKSPTV
ncbi:MAG: hypothetical protein NXY57DRAFT_963279 [Lentinula lateritia]|nr:hypothetical protein EV359DRAFT_81556 [Lentinula novae-zelandiae]KAJ3929795.1 MAG: hypothetical protein NXY57DRAFT_963279 [Lentinula lateritia]